jgi:competence transcription factor ComK
MIEECLRSFSSYQQSYKSFKANSMKSELYQTKLQAQETMIYERENMVLSEFIG